VTPPTMDRLSRLLLFGLLPAAAVLALVLWVVW
jgi:hypothetical protein